MAPTPVIMKYKVSGESTTHGTMGPAYFNSFLDTTGISPTKNARLTITLRIGLIQIGPGMNDSDMVKWPSGAATGLVKNLWEKNEWVPCIPWDNASYSLFGADMRKEAESFWGASDPTWGNKGFTLVNIDKNWTGLHVSGGSGAPTHQANVECDFHIEWTTDVDSSHVLIYAARLAPGTKTICSWMSPGTAKRKGKGFLSTNSFTLNRAGLCAATLSSGGCASNAVIAHEIGHALGLPHIGLTIAGSTCNKEVRGDGWDRFVRFLGIKGYDTNRTSCYTGETHTDKENVMGMGSTIAIPNTDPWRIRIADHTQTPIGKWAVVLDRWTPIELSHFHKG